MTLSKAELSTLDDLRQRWDAQAVNDSLMWRYYHGRQRVEQLGMAIPPALRQFLVVTNWPRVVVDTPAARQQVRAFLLPDQDAADPTLRMVMAASNFPAHFRMFNRDRLVYGRAFMSVSTNEKARDLPLVRAESPRQIVAAVDVRREVMTAAARFYGGTTADPEPVFATLYLPNVTIWCELDEGVWREKDRDDHKLGSVPLVMHLNRREAGGWLGESEMVDIIPLADSAARSMTNMQWGQEAHGMPRKWMTGVDRKDFVDASGKPITQFEAYFDAIHTVSNSAAKIGQLTASDLKNFATALDEYRKEAALRYGFPARYFGLTTANPPAEGAIIADEINLVRGIEAANDEIGVTLGWVAALAHRMATGSAEVLAGVRTEWFDPATPTMAQREDALMKRRSAGVLSRRGYWTELGWSPERMDQEETWLAEEASSDPLVSTAKSLMGGGLSVPADAG